MKPSNIEHANLVWNEQGAPVSQLFDDVYFSKQNGLDETRYVFLQGNQLPERIMHTSAQQFVVAETGFGTGLNFLTLLQAHQQAADSTATARPPRLYFVSVEKYPLTTMDLQQAHRHWPELAHLSALLVAQWPENIAGCHRLIFDHGAVTLDLWFGDINQLMEDLEQSLQGKVDAWFLDGFAPSKNPDMWSERLFNLLARTAKPQATFATFTAAGFVRRGLQQAGFKVIRRKGFGIKREMLTGYLPQALAPKITTPWYPKPAARSPDIALIGGGIASACLAVALIRRGFKVTLYSFDAKPASGASGNRQAALYPLLHAQDPQLATFFAAAFTFVKRFYHSLPFTVEHDWCGVVQLGWDSKSHKKIEQMMASGLPNSIASAIDAKQASQLLGVEVDQGGMYYPHGGWISPAELTTWLINWASEQGMTCHWQQEVTALDTQDGAWQLSFAHQPGVQHQQVVLANGHRLNQLAISAPLPVYPVAGQVSHIAGQRPLADLAKVLCYEGYLTPASPRYQTHSLGASYRRGQSECHYREEDQQANLARLKHCLPNSQWAQQVELSCQQARVAVRCATRDHLPLVGALPNYTALVQDYQKLLQTHSREQIAQSAPVWPGLFVLGALGARGVCSAPLAAEILAAQLNGEPLPLDKKTLNALQPNRYWIRKLLKGRPI